MSVICAVILGILPFLDYSNPLPKNVSGEITILSLVHVDEFEGGEGSRASFLKRRAVEFQKNHKNVFIEVRSASESELAAFIRQGIPTDLISFSKGIGEDVFPILLPYGGKVNFRSDLIAAVSGGSKVYAAPWCMGGYALIKKSGKDVKRTYCGSSAYSNPYTALKESGLKSLGDMSQAEAYQQFSTGNDCTYLLGTQRDIVRCEMRMEQGKLENIEITPYSGTDLLQCIGITSKSEKNRMYANAFIEYLTSDTAQRKTTEIGMINVIGERFYSSGGLAALEEKLALPISDADKNNVFLSREKILALREECKNAC